MRLFILSLISFLLCSPAVAGTLKVYTYHDKPPYYMLPDIQIQAGIIGIYQHLINQLNQRQNKIQLQLQFLPRKRLNQLLENNRLQGAIIGVNPLWFKDKSKQKFSWSYAFIDDKDVLVVKRNQQFDYQQPSDLKGKTLAVSRGYYYLGITELINAGEVGAEYTSSDLQNLKLVKQGRADAAILSPLTLKFVENNILEPNLFSVLDQPHDRFSRHILFPKQYHQAFLTLNPLINDIIKQPEWRDYLASLGH